MTDDQIAELLGWPRGRTNRDSSLMHRIRIVVAEAQAEKEAAERAEREAREAAERAEREAREAAERDARQREAERMGRLQAAAEQMFDALRMVRASGGFTGLGREAQEAVVDALKAATEPEQAAA